MDVIRHLTEPLTPSVLANTVVAVMLLEPLALAGYRLFTAKGPTALESVTIILPGLFLIMVLKAAVEGASVWIMAPLLVGAFVAHIADMWIRFR